MLWTSRSEKRLALALLRSAVISDVPVCSVGVWHNAHPMALNICLPLAIEAVPPGVSVEGVGGASNRMNIAKPMASPDASTVLVACSLDLSSGVGFSLQLI